jgi:predicted dienelactone hydrolase
VNFVRYAKSSLISFVLGVSAVFFPVAVVAAERITFNFPPFGQFFIKVEDLETFVNTGEVSSELAYYLDRLSPQQVGRLPELLSTPLEFHPLSITKFSNSTIGEAVIKNFGKGIRADVNQNGFLALRGAIIAAAFDSQGLTAINVLRQFPLETIYVDLQVLDQYIQQGEKLFQQREVIDREFFTNYQSQTKALSNNNSELGQQPDLRTPGQYLWQKQTFTYNNPNRLQPGYFDLYQPEITQPVPLIVISHGLASNRQTFAYLGKHLASYGFAVAVIEHDDISLDRFDNFLSGTAKFPEPNNLIDQPLDVKYVLDKLEQESQVNSQLKNKINLQQVGIIGQSFGGYTSLALAGGKLIADKTAVECQKENYQDVLLDLSSLARCTSNQLPASQYQLRDPRIKAAIAINPLGKIFGQTGMSSIKIPTMIIAGTHDLITPPVAEQIEPFTWLNKDLKKYLVLVKPGTHFSFLQVGLGVLPVPDDVVGPNPTSAHPSLKAISTAFFKVHLAHQLKYQNHLQSDYPKGTLCLRQLRKRDRSPLLNNDAFEFSIIRSLTPAKLEQLNIQLNN